MSILLVFFWCNKGCKSRNSLICPLVCGETGHYKIFCVNVKYFIVPIW